MNPSPSESHRRILVVDDNRAIHDDFRKILGGRGQRKQMEADEAILFGKSAAAPEPIFELHFAHQGEEALAMVQQALAENRPYAMAFMDVRMPPGWDGIETTARIWPIDPELQIVICTAYSDYSWSEVLRKVGQSDRLVILKKPFDNVEAIQLASALTEKWRLARQARQHLAELQAIIAERTRELQAAKDEAAGIAERTKSELLATIGRELAPPVTRVLDTTGQLAGTELSPLQREHINTLRRSADTLLHIVNETHAGCRIGAASR